MFVEIWPSAEDGVDDVETGVGPVGEEGAVRALEFVAVCRGDELAEIL